MHHITIPTPPSELLDRISVLEIKTEHITDTEKLSNVQRELELLRTVRNEHIPHSSELEELYGKLKSINTCIWNQLDQWEVYRRKNIINVQLAELLHAVQINNNEERFPIKRAIDTLLKSDILEEKSYGPS